ncbi:MmcQ/YjbR family DNA-binding protein [Halioxenophilus sp. WMMB6]|uniref:MmcQ/YjbR family DNA-binding protein n=1 Tax=Halioxenophilus sp. WMMB6 TaxID=3073815 RepID=UPI00295EFC27|nr:MmcQ/YjbR family DNA-binding protein [Halioxenophilus sp. WMMB6]
MDYQAVKNYCLAKPEAELDYPFGPDAAVIKVRGKLFAILSERQGVAQVNLKCDPYRAQALRDLYPAVIPGYHMNKKHWNTVLLDHTLVASEIELMIDHSYSLIIRSLKRADRQFLSLRYGDALFEPI